MIKMHRAALLTLLLISIAVLLLGLGACDGKMYTLEFDTNDGSIVEPLISDGLSFISMPDEPSKDGYSFGGWFYDNNTFNEPFDVFEYYLKDNLTVYAKWIAEGEVVEYIITFVTNGGNLVNDITVEANKRITKPADPVKEAHSFLGWFLDNDTFEQPANMLNHPITASRTVYAKWLVNPRIAINLDDGRQIRLELYPTIAPITVANFLSLVDDDYYDNTVSHRLIKNFMIQAGMLEISGAGLKYKPTVDTIVGEFNSNGYSNNLNHTLGVISMARATQNDSASAQFFICSATSTHLDGNYAAFGKTIDEESNQVILSLNNYPTYTSPMQDFPLTPEGNLVVITSIERI